MKKLIFIFTIFFLVLTPVIVTAYTMQVEYPTITSAQPTTGLVDYIRYVYLFALGTVGLVAFGVMVYGGILYMMSGANPSLQGDAKEWFKAAISGLLLALASYLILNTINPNLVKIKAPTLPATQLPTGITFLNIGDTCDPNKPPLCNYNLGLVCKDTKILGKIYECVLDTKTLPQPTSQSQPTQPTQPISGQTYSCSSKCSTNTSITASSSNSPDCASCESYVLTECNKNCTNNGCTIDQKCIANITPKVTP